MAIILSVMRFGLTSEKHWLKDHTSVGTVQYACGHCVSAYDVCFGEFSV